MNQRFVWKPLLVGMLVMGWAVTAWAQPRGGGMMEPEEMVKMQLDRMTEALALTEEQQEAVQPILLETVTARRDLMGKVRDGSMERAEVRTEMQALTEAQDEKLSEILSEQQMADFVKLREEWGPRGGRRGGGPGTSGNA